MTNIPVVLLVLHVLLQVQGPFLVSLQPTALLRDAQRQITVHQPALVLGGGLELGSRGGTIVSHLGKGGL